MQNSKKKSLLLTLFQREEGAVLPLVGLTFVVLMLASGFAIDYTRASIVKERLQWAVDSAALAGAHAGTNGNAGDVRDAATRYFNANFPDGYMGVNGRPSLSVSAIRADTGSFGGAAKGWRVNTGAVNVPTWIMGFMGWKNMQVSASADVNSAPLTPLDVVMSFDLSGSMAVTAGRGCVFADWCESDYGPCGYAPYCYGGTSKLDEAKSEMRSLVNRLSSKSTRFGLIGWHPNVRTKQGLTSNTSTIKGAINSMSVGGNTDGALGMREAKDMILPSGALNRGIIFLTDGVNTSYYGNGSTCCSAENSADANAKEKQLCAEAKAQGVNVYTIAYDLNRNDFSDDNKPYVDAAKATLTECASSVCLARTDRSDGLCYFDAANATQLRTAMEVIGKSMLTVRLTR